VSERRDSSGGPQPEAPTVGGKLRRADLFSPGQFRKSYALGTYAWRSGASGASGARVPAVAARGEGLGFAAIGARYTPTAWRLAHGRWEGARTARAFSCSPPLRWMGHHHWPPRRATCRRGRRTASTVRTLSSSATPSVGPLANTVPPRRQNLRAAAPWGSASRGGLLPSAAAVPVTCTPRVWHCAPVGARRSSTPGLNVPDWRSRGGAILSPTNQAQIKPGCPAARPRGASRRATRVRPRAH
jgi:hypothetical protein